MFLVCDRKLENPCRYEENLQTPHWKAQNTKSYCFYFIINREDDDKILFEPVEQLVTEHSTYLLEVTLKLKRLCALCSDSSQAVCLYETPLKFYDQLYWIISFVYRHKVVLVLPLLIFKRSMFFYWIPKNWLPGNRNPSENKINMITFPGVTLNFGSGVLEAFKWKFIRREEKMDGEYSA